MQDGPPGRGQSGIRIAVSLNVPVELGSPIRGVPPRRRTVIRASVPEAAINEYRHPGAGENDVRADAQSRDAVVNAISEALSVQEASQGQLWSRVRPAVGTHGCQRVGVRGGRRCDPCTKCHFSWHESIMTG